MRGKIFVVAILIGLSAAVARAEAPKFELQKTPGGLEFWYAARPDLPKDTLAAGWRDGVGFAIPGKEGLSFVGVRVLMRLASNWEFDNITEGLRDLGADGNFSTNGWHTFATLTAPPRNLEAAADLAGRLFATPPPDEKLLDKIETGLSDNVATEEKRAETAVVWAVRRLGQKALPLNGPRENPGSYHAITRDDVETWRRKVFARDNFFLAVEGPSSAEAFAAVIDKLFSPFAPSSDVPPRPVIPFTARPQTIVIESPQAQTMIRETAGTDVTLGPDRLEYYVAMETLGGGFESRLWAEIRQTLGVSYALETGLSEDRDHEQMFFGGEVANERAVEALTAMNRVYADWREKGVTAAELAAVVSRVKAELDDRFRRPGIAPRAVVVALLTGSAANSPFEYADRLASLTAEGINDAIRQKFPAGPLLTIIAAPSAAPFHADCVIANWREVEKCK
jgi:zinc protease